MPGVALLVFREVMEAALIVSIVCAATRGVRRRGLYVAGGIGSQEFRPTAENLHRIAVRR